MSYQPPQYPQQPPQQPSGPPYVPGPPPPQYGPAPQYGPQYGAPYSPQTQTPRKRRKWPWIVGGIVLAMILGCVGVFTLIIGGTGAAVKGLDDNQKGKNAVAGAMGKPSVDGKFQFTVTGMHCGVPSVGDDVLGKKAQGNFCLINVTIKNVGSSAEIFDSNSQKATGPDGTQFSTDPTAETYVNSQDQTFLEDINPGNQVKGTLLFDVPKGVALSSITLHESMFTPGVKIPLHQG